MGSEQSSGRKSPAATPKDVERALERQRKMYEAKMSQLMQETKKTGAPMSAPSIGPLNSLSPTAASSSSGATKLQSSTNSQQPMTSAGIPSVSPSTAMSQPHPSSAVNLDRQHYPYNNNQHNFFGQHQGTLYPNLHQAPASQVYIPQARHGENNSVYYNSYYTTNQQPQRYASPQPSAPPREASSSRSRSQSRQRDVEDAFKCVTCGHTYGERIYQCNQGHSSCELCKTRQVFCGKCRLQLTDRRNFDLEKCVSDRKVQCPNTVDGCRLHIRMADMAIHEKECPFKKLQCPSLGSSCNWSGRLSQLADHFKDMHPLHNQGEVDKELTLSNINNTSHLLHYIRIGPFNFLFHIKVSQPDRRMYMLVQLIGTRNSAAKWEYEIHMYKKNEPRRKFQYIDKCLSSNEPIQGIIDSAKCAVIPQDYAKTFICGGSVAYKFYIKRHDDKANDSEINNATNEKEKGNNSRPRRHNFKKYVKKNHAIN